MDNELEKSMKCLVNCKPVLKKLRQFNVKTLNMNQM